MTLLPGYYPWVQHVAYSWFHHVTCLWVHHATTPWVHHVKISIVWRVETFGRSNPVFFVYRELRFAVIYI